MQLTALLKHCASLRASDLHLSPREPPIMRLHGQLHRLVGPALEAESLAAALLDWLPQTARARLADALACDFRLSVPEGTCRVHVYQQQHGLSAAIRLLPPDMPDLDALGLPATVAEWAQAPHGLILICGATGSGKSTTLAALIHRINQQRACHILTLEDPIEFQHRGIRALVTQREADTTHGGFAAVLRAALREDPDVIMVGEMRDRETVRLALEAAETGHLVLATLHTRSAASAITRICGSFPTETQHAVRLQLAQSLHAIIAQAWLPCRRNCGRVLAHEVLLATHAVRHLIRENRLEQIETLLQTGQQQGMHTMRQCIDHLAALHDIAVDSARWSSE
ncbi:MAG: PilT/PilU family type 4a pilus ATPase [Paludibacterium sp.]|uniref:type IV pilus twitching motility protein PilT n=1 Tax=Paludibacterium sp. TaxID=1917523 RepID=UPI0025DF21AD|nr:PilT/PilU family type 4a pilus ATPase [Paludibacterium sp.]MBV8046506.1 PilT/PilU family type 4a pilus ATPase [Paludibacterium sp.]MBV8648002.1 PilT/PilU family type 4a pilus ATPase [Paludibacterium sp.]